MGTRSTFRSIMIKTGRLDGTPGNDLWLPEKRLSLELRMWSRSFRSSLVAISSAAPPFGHRIIGMEPSQLAHAFFNPERRDPYPW